MSKSNGWITVIHNNYDDIKNTPGTYDNTDWVDKQKNRVQNFEKEKEISISRNIFLIDFVNKMKADKVRIVDYGGGFGLSYLPLVSKTDKKIEYHIVEVPGVSTAASKMYADNKDIFFYSSLLDLNNLDFDIAYIRTSLQYAADWKWVLESLADLSPKNIILADASIGDIKTFLTFQSWGSEKIPYWFINEKDLVETLVNKNYKITKREIARDITKDVSWETQRAYPAEYRIDSLVNIVFSRG
tara:strand:- start:19 stop:747 length:729 start_codon:yes stop_codon:yes gene_type:complete